MVYPDLACQCIDLNNPAVAPDNSCKPTESLLLRFSGHPGLSLQYFNDRSWQDARQAAPDPKQPVARVRRAIMAIMRNMTDRFPCQPSLRP